MGKILIELMEWKNRSRVPSGSRDLCDGKLRYVKSQHFVVRACALNGKQSEEERKEENRRGAENRKSLISMQVTAGWKRASNYKNGSQAN